MPACPPTNRAPRGEVFYDAECRFCRRGMRRWGGLFARRGFAWVPLQTVGVAARLGLPAAELAGEMKLRHADGRICGGVDAWAALFRSVWWLWPLGAVLAVPGLRELGALAYRWIARNRHCLGGRCALPDAAPRRHAVFWEMP